LHIPDGYLSPSTCAVMYAAAAPFWVVALRRVRSVLSTQMVPTLALFSAFAFVAQMFAIPLFGGTTGHPVGATLIALVLGFWPAVIGVSITLIVQALFFGDGGITAIGANCFNMAVVMPSSPSPCTACSPAAMHPCVGASGRQRRLATQA
jgi:cobalt/nickel transport system permease protein